MYHAFFLMSIFAVFCVFPLVAVYMFDGCFLVLYAVVASGLMQLMQQDTQIL